MGGSSHPVASGLPASTFAADTTHVSSSIPPTSAGRHDLSTITTPDGTQIYYNDWDTAQPVVFSHGWPLSPDEGATRGMCTTLKDEANEDLLAFLKA
jgi:hypothetical protein